MSYLIHRSESRGKFEFDWLRTHHTFSFGEYHNPERIQFGKLRVLNDDEIAPGGGFPTHPHRDMEIVTIPLSGALRHKDSTGSDGVIHAGEVQIMSAGTGIRHSEENASKTEEVTLLQIWILPEKMGISPRYEQKAFPVEERKNKLQWVVRPDKKEGALWINQSAYFSRLALSNGKDFQYEPQTANQSLYLFVIEGEVEAEGEMLGKRDAIGWNIANQAKFRARKDSELVLMEV